VRRYPESKELIGGVFVVDVPTREVAAITRRFGDLHIAEDAAREVGTTDVQWLRPTA
jgi:hypothetical protein